MVKVAEIKKWNLKKDNQSTPFRSYFCNDEFGWMSNCHRINDRQVVRADTNHGSRLDIFQEGIDR